MKQCSFCRELKPFEEYWPDKRNRSGLQARCRTCYSEYAKAYRQSNKERVKTQKAAKYARDRDAILKQKADYYRQNVDRLKVYKKAYQRANLDRAAASNRKYSAANRDKGAARSARYRASQLRATPAWANLDKIEEYYTAARFLSMVTGEWYEVDHVVPLQSKFVCGLHVDNNLRVIPQPDNRSKANRFWPNMP